MESRTVSPEDKYNVEGLDIPDELRDAIEEEFDYLSRRDIKLIRYRAREDSSEVFQATIYADDEMYRLNVVAPGTVSRTIFRNPEVKGDIPYLSSQEEEVDEEEEQKSETQEEPEEDSANETNDETEDESEQESDSTADNDEESK